MSGDINYTRNFKSAKIGIIFLFYVLSFFKKGDTIQGGTFFKGGHYLRKYGIYMEKKGRYEIHVVIKIDLYQIHRFPQLPP